MQFELKIVGNRLVIDMNAGYNEDFKCQGYDGAPKWFDMIDIVPAVVIGMVELAPEILEKIKAEYLNGGKCGWCDEIVSELRTCHIFDSSPTEKMCRVCWDHDREVYKGSYDEDIGPFNPSEEVKVNTANSEN